MKIGYSAQTGFVRVAIDENNSGNFHICLNEKVDLSPSWWQKAYIGISAATGQLADNHDILAVETVMGVGDPDLVTVSPLKENQNVEDQNPMLMSELLKESGVDENSLTDLQKGLLRVMERVDKEQSLKISKLKRELEHSLVGMNDERL